MKRRKEHEKRWLWQERNYKLYIRRGMDYYNAGLCSGTHSIKAIQSALVVQRLKHVTKGKHWFGDSFYPTLEGFIYTHEKISNYEN
jgi:hypothetical protein